MDESQAVTFAVPAIVDVHDRLIPGVLHTGLTMASAVSLIRFSLTLQAKLFQLFHPMGGVRASPSNFWAWALPARTQAMSSGDGLS